MGLVDGLVANLPLQTDFNDCAGQGLEISSRGIELGAPGPNQTSAARFNGADSWLEIAGHPSLQLGTDDVTLSL